MQVVNTILLVLIAYGYNGGLPEETLITLVLTVSVFIVTLLHYDVNHFSWTRRGATLALQSPWRRCGQGRASTRQSATT